MNKVDSDGWRECQFNVILDTNWLMDSSQVAFPLPWAFNKEHPNDCDDPWSRVESEVAESQEVVTFGMKIIIPEEVKSEVGRLHEKGGLEARTSNAKRNYSILQKHFSAEPPWVSHRKFPFDFYARDQIKLEEVVLPAVLPMFEPVIGPDSEVDKGLITLAQCICDQDPVNICYIATSDTGIHSEISHRNYRMGVRMYGPHMKLEWEMCVNQAASILAKILYPEKDWGAGKIPPKRV